MLDFTALDDHLNARVLQVLQDIVPGGRLVGPDYVAGSKLGGPGDSFKYNIRKFTGADFATDETFGDLISLYADIQNLPQIDAAKTLADQYGFRIPEQAGPNFKHFKHGMPVKTWPYHDHTGQIISYVARYDTSEGKQFCPFTLIDGKWSMKHLPVPRPLYNLPALNNHQDRPVIIVEGEKSCDACRALVAERYAVISWPCGAKAVSKVDWTPLKDKRCIIWPDADRPGREAADHIYSFISKIAASVKILRTQDLPEGFDAADFTGQWPELRQFIVDRLPATTAKPPVALPNTRITATETVDPDDIDAPIITGSLHEAWIELGIAVNRNGNAVANMDNVTRVLEGCIHFRGNIWYDEFLDKIQYRENGRVNNWSDIHDIKTAIKLQRHLGLTGVTDGMVFKAVSAYASMNTKNVITDYLSSLEWDQTPRLSTFFNDICGAEDTDYTRSISQNFLISMVARAFNQGCKVDTMPILEGKQGAKKSTLLEILAGKQYHANISSNLHDKDFFQCMQGKWTLEFAELHQFSKADITKVKDILSASKDTYRSSYGRTPADHPRKSVFAGTTNEETYLSDNTGARRFWPIAIKFIDIDRLIRDRNQYFAEAVALYRAGNSWWEVPESAADCQEERRIRDPWEDDIKKFLHYKNEITTTDILTDCLKIETARKTKFDEMRVASILRLIGFTRKRKRIGADLYWVYHREASIMNSENVVDFEE